MCKGVCYSHLIISFSDASKMITARLIIKQCGIFTGDKASVLPQDLHHDKTCVFACVHACVLVSDVYRFQNLDSGSNREHPSSSCACVSTEHEVKGK